MKKQVGAFTIENDVLSGPKQYMEERGNAKLERMLAGEDVVFNTSLLHSPDTATGVLVALQTDYAGWLGQKELERCMQ